mmetsp:Transcript_120969/g.328276  ORF Transcript_120969/g.328276 Transcript_120969/m.328276 type:complete len:202 (-) Transcript_120969:1225-1830(-)
MLSSGEAQPGSRTHTAGTAPCLRCHPGRSCSSTLASSPDLAARARRFLHLRISCTGALAAGGCSCCCRRAVVSAPRSAAASARSSSRSARSRTTCASAPVALLIAAPDGPTGRRNLLSTAPLGAMGCIVNPATSFAGPLVKTRSPFLSKPSLLLESGDSKTVRLALVTSKCPAPSAAGVSLLILLLRLRTSPWVDISATGK